MSEPSLTRTRKNLLYLRVNPQNLRKVRVPLTKIRSQSNLLTPLIPSLLLLLLLRISARGRETPTKKIPARPNSPNQSLKNLPPKNKKSSTSTLLLVPLARKLLLSAFAHLFLFGFHVFILLLY